MSVPLRCSHKFCSAVHVPRKKILWNGEHNAYYMSWRWDEFSLKEYWTCTKSFFFKICNTICNIIDVCFQRYHAFFRYISTCIPIIIQANILMLFMVWTKKGKVYKQEAFFLVPRLLSLKICYPKDICLKALFLLILSTWWKKSISMQPKAGWV